MKINKTYKFRIYPNKEQEQKLANFFGSCRFVYNYFLAERKNQYKETGKSDNYYAQKRKLAALKNQEEYSWLYETNSQSLQVAVNQVEKAYVNFFSKRTGFPKFHSKKSRQSFTITQGIRLSDNRIFIPKLKKGIKVKLHQKINGTIKFGSIIKYPTGKYYVNLTTEESIVLKPKAKKQLGIDLGIKNLLITSDGLKFDNPRFIKQYEKQLADAQKHLSRKNKNSHQFERQKLKVAKIQEKIANCRKDNLHKITYKLTNLYSDIFVEDLNVQKMKQDHLLAKEISDCSWGAFINMLEYKGKWYNCNVFKISRYYPSSKTCSNCNYTLETLNLNDREWTCPKCGKKHDRDINAAINILNEGLREKSSGTGDYTDGEIVRTKSRKRNGRISKKSEDHLALASD